MKSSTLLPLLSILPLTSAWSITWNDPSGKDHTRTGHGPSACIPIDNPKGHLFRIDAQGETGINMLLFTNGDCEGDASGMATDVFSKDASKDLLGFRVVKLESATGTGNSTATATATATTTSKAHSSHLSTTGGSSSASAGSSSVVSTTTQIVVTSAAATTSAGGSPSSSSSSAASASTSNAAVRVAGSRADVAKGIVGGMLGLVVVPMMI